MVLAAAKAKQIADWLGNFDEHRTHGRPIGYDLAHEKGLNVTRLEADQKLQEAVLSAYHATMVTFLSTQCLKIVENQNGKGHYVVAQLIMQPGLPAPVPAPPTQRRPVTGSTDASRPASARATTAGCTRSACTVVGSFAADFPKAEPSVEFR
jgi:hypothetical protein